MADRIEDRDTIPQYETFVSFLTRLPKNIMSVHQRDNVPEFVLYDLCSERGFNIPKAAYFIDNPDFNTFQGIAGYTRSEGYTGSETVWDDPETFTLFMRSSPFNQKVRTLTRASGKFNGHRHEDMVEEIARGLNITNPSFLSWDVKHYNHGLLVFERAGQKTWSDDYFEPTVHFLSFCPIR